MIELNEQLQRIESDIEHIENEIKVADSIDKIAYLSKELNIKLVKKYTINFKLSQLEKNLPILGYEIEVTEAVIENNRKTNSTI